MTTSPFLRRDRTDEEPALDYLIAALTAPASSVRAAATYTLGQYGGQAACAALLQALSDCHAMVREEAAYALGCIEDMCAITGLLQACADPDAAVRRTAAEALDKLAARQERRAYTFLTVASSAT